MPVLFPRVPLSPRCALAGVAHRLHARRTTDTIGIAVHFHHNPAVEADNETRILLLAGPFHRIDHYSPSRSSPSDHDFQLDDPNHSFLERNGSTYQNQIPTHARIRSGQGRIKGLPNSKRTNMIKSESGIIGDNSVKRRLNSISQYCLKCHSLGHWKMQCDPDMKTGIFTCQSEDLETFAVDAASFKQDRNKVIGSTEQLISHICHAVRRLNYYESYVTKRDVLFMTILGESTTDERVSDQYMLAQLNGILPYEAYVSRTCRLTHVLVKTCAAALVYLRKVCVVSLVNPGEFDADPNAQSKLYLVPFLNKHFDQLADDMATGSQQTLLDSSRVSKGLIRYNEMIDTAWKEYTTAMNELAGEWHDLDTAYDLWRSRPAEPRKTVLRVLPFLQLRVDMDSEANFTLRTLHFPKVGGSIRHYVDTWEPVQEQDTKIADDDMANDTIENGSILSTEEEIKILLMKNEILEKANEVFKKETEISKKEIEIFKKENEVLKKEIGILQQENTELKKASRSQLAGQVAEPQVALPNIGEGDKSPAGRVEIAPHNFQRMLRQISRQTPQTTGPVRNESQGRFSASRTSSNAATSTKTDLSAASDSNQNSPVLRHQSYSSMTPNLRIYSTELSTYSRNAPSVATDPRQRVQPNTTILPHSDSRDEGECTDEDH